MRPKYRESPKRSLRDRVVEAVLQLGQCTTNEVLAIVGRYISASQAVLAGRRRLKVQVKRHEAKKSRLDTESPRSLVAIGRKRIVSEYLCRCVRKGRIRRVSNGIYAPVLPRISNTDGAETRRNSGNPGKKIG